MVYNDINGYSRHTLDYYVTTKCGELSSKLWYLHKHKKNNIKTN